jgi:aspartate ammonia-lyase
VLQRPAAAVLRSGAGLGEINLPPVQAGSSIMPGKANPEIPAHA